MFVAVAAGAAVLLVVVAHRTHAPVRRGFLLSVAAGILYGTTAGLVKVATSFARPGPGPGLGGPGPGAETCSCTTGRCGSSRRPASVRSS